MADFQKINGACFCGENQFEITQPAVDTHHCHCSICRRLQGAAFVTLSIFPETGFRWTKGGKLDTFNSSPTVHRNRCQNCGSPLTIYLDGFPGLVAIPRADLPVDATPGEPPATLRHAFWPDRVGWISISDSLPKAQGFDK